MAGQYSVNVSADADGELQIMVDYLAEEYGVTYALRLDALFDDAIDNLAINPKRHMRIRYLVGRQFVYRRVLVGKKRRLIFTIDEPEMRVEVVRIDFQSSDPRTLDDLP